MYIMISAILFGTIIFGGQIFVEMGFSSYEITIFRLIPGLILLPLIIFKKEYRITKEMIPTFLAFGFIGSINMITQYTSLSLGVPVAIAVFLLYTQPLWTTIFGKLFLKENLTKYKIVAVVLSLIGIGIMIDPFNIPDIGSLVGIGLAVIAGICLSAWVIYSRKAGLKKYNPVTTTVGYVIFILLFTILSIPITGSLIQDQTIIRITIEQPIEIWGYFVIYFIFSTLIPFILFYKGMQKIQATSAGIVLMLEPISASLLAFVLLSQPLTLNILAGGALILISNYLVIRKK